MSDLTFEALRQASWIHMHQWAPDEASRLKGDWALPPARFGDNTQAPLPPKLLAMLSRLQPDKLAPVLAELVMQIDRLCATKRIDLGDAITQRLQAIRGGVPPDLSTTLKEPVSQ